MLSTLTKFLSFFFFNDTATTEIYPLSLPGALPISSARAVAHARRASPLSARRSRPGHDASPRGGAGRGHALARRVGQRVDRKSTRLNSSHSQISYAVFCLKKKKPTRSCPQATSFQA